MRYSLPIVLIGSIVCFIGGRYILGSVLIGLFFVILLGLYLMKLLPGQKEPVDLNAESAIPNLTERFNKYGKYMAGYKIHRDSGPQDGWVMPGRKAILLVYQFLEFKRPDIPIEMLCAGIEEDFKAYDQNEGITPIQDQKMEARLRLLSAIAQSTNSGLLKSKISQYIKEAESRGVNLKDGIMTNPLPANMI